MKQYVLPKREVSLDKNDPELVFRTSILEGGRITIPARLRHLYNFSCGVGVSLRLLSFFVERTADDQTEEAKTIPLKKINTETQEEKIADEA